ncbi:MAG: pyrroline-5-carboxylate reductase [Deltaproteobacteria bacterium]|nr:pyrroline-5-carboxylate reductase [Deltaproteobacteria bacterium]
MKKIGFIGAGNMAGALLKGLLAAKLYRPQDMLVSDVVPVQLRKIKRAYRVEGLNDNRAVVRAAQTIILAVKPQIIDQVLADIQSEVTKEKLFVSIAAGVPLRRLENGLGSDARVVRVMPNTPALLGKGIAVVVRGHKAKPQDEKLTLTLFRGVGEALAVKDEALMDPVTGLSGSGPAYVYLFAEALIAGGIQAGLSPAVATRLTLQTIEGAVAMLKETGKNPQELRAMVTSPGGTTLAGLSVLTDGKFVETIAGAVSAATRRSKELGQG